MKTDTPNIIGDLQIKSKQNFGLNLQITKKCNFNCTYCYEIGQHRDESSTLENAAAVIRLAKEINSDTQQDIELTFIGGEPTLNAEYALPIITELHRAGILANVHLITNGWSSGLIKSFFGDLPKEKISIQISYDGKEINDKFRRMGSKTTTDLVLNNFEDLIDSGYNVNLKSTMPIDAMHTVPDTLREFEALSEKFGIFLRYYPTEDFTTTFSKERQFEDYEEYFDKHFQEVFQIEVGRLKRGLPAMTRWFRDYDFKGQAQCNAGVSFFTINEAGDVQYCHHVDYTADAPQQLEYCNVEDPEAWSKMKEVSRHNQSCIKEQIHECDSCDALYCLKCPILNFMITKDKDKIHGKHAVPFMCQYYKAMTKYIYIYDKLLREYKAKGI